MSKNPLWHVTVGNMLFELDAEDEEEAHEAVMDMLLEAVDRTEGLTSVKEPLTLIDVEEVPGSTIEDEDDEED